MADANTPAWLQANTTEAPPPVADNGLGVTSVAPPAPPALSSNNEAADTDDDPDLPGVILTMRLANMGVAVAIITVSVILMAQLRSVSSFVLAIYATCGGLLICCLETQLKFVRVMIALNFGFLFNSVWRFIFYLMMGSVAWSYDNLFGKIVAIAFAAVACFNTYVLCRYPAYRRIREKIAEEEDKRIESRISKEVKKQASVSTR